MIGPAEADLAQPVGAKVDPEVLVLRGRPAAVTRFRRRTIIALAAVSSTAVIGVGWLALGGSSARAPVLPEERPLAADKPGSDVFGGAPASYADIPKLGPPLPGDLGRPILEEQRQNGSTASSVPDAYEAAAQRAEAERQRVAAEQRAARESGLMISLTRSAPATGAGNSVVASDSESIRPGGPAGAADPGGQIRNSDFIGRANSGADVNPHRIEPPASPWILQAGSIISASLITGLNSELPGMVTAQVTQNAYDSITGRTLLIPQGSRLVGSYDSVVAFGQSRALVVWQRIILPDGSSIRIDNVPASDAAGYAGLADRVDRHSWQLLKGVVLSTLLGIGGELSWGSSESDLVRAIRESAQQAGGRAGDQLVARNLDIQPTLRVRPGWPLRIVVHKDIVLQPWDGGAG